MEKKMIVMIIGCAILGVVYAHAQSANIVAPKNSKDCKSVLLMDAANTQLGPYAMIELQQKYTQAVADSKRLKEQLGFDDAQIASSSIGIQSLNTCTINSVNGF